jgi:hypothetical protein
MSSCKECNSTECLDYQRNSGYRKTSGYVFYQRAYGLARSSRNKGIPADPQAVLKKHLMDLWEQQEGRCFYTGEPMSLTGYPEQDAMTVDRVVPAQGYVKGNVVLCRSLVNRMKQDMEWDAFVAMCRVILKNDKRVRSSLQ